MSSGIPNARVLPEPGLGLPADVAAFDPVGNRECLNGKGSKNALVQ